MRTADLNGMIDRWTADGVITREQAGRLRADVPRPAPRTGLLAEGLGYLGGALVVAGLGLVAGRYWEQLGSAGRLAVMGAAALLLAVAGAVVPRAAKGPFARLRAVVWLCACGAVLGLLLLLADDPIGWDGEAALSFASAGASLCAAGFWAAHRHPVQHIAAYLSVLLLGGSLVALLPHAGSLPGLAIWALGAAWALLAWGGLVRPAMLGRWLGAAGLAAGAVAVAGERWGSVLAVVSVAVLVGASVVVRDMVLLGVASAGALFILPPVVGLWFPGVLSAALALLAVGLLLVGAAVTVARRGRPRPGGQSSAGGGPTTGTLLPAVASAAVLIAVATAIVLVRGL